MIRPTVGRVILMFSSLWVGPRPADVTKVWSDTCVNVLVKLDNDDKDLRANHGNVMPLTSVLLYEPDAGPKYQPAADGDAVAPAYHAEWMPYQVGQAPGSSAVQEELKKATEKIAELDKRLEAYGEGLGTLSNRLDILAGGVSSVNANLGSVSTVVSDLTNRLSRIEQQGSTGLVPPPPAQPGEVPQTGGDGQ